MAASPERPKTVVVVGGSLAGLMHALTLVSLPNPPQVRILERSPTGLLHNQGAGIIARDETLEYFERIVRPGHPITVTSHSRHYLDRQGNEIPDAVENRPQQMVSWDLLYHLLRWRVNGLQSPYTKSLKTDDRPKTTYEHGCKVTRIEDFGASGVRVTWTKAETGTTETATADLVIAADGASSTLRAILEPETQRKYAGYVAWRGTVPEDELSADAKTAFVEKMTFYHSTGTQSLGYVIPGPNGTIEKGARLFNWVWYVNYDENGADLKDLMTDKYGRKHNITLPVGGMQDEIWEKQKKFASEVLPRQFAEAVEKTRQPFIQAITDSISSRCSFLNGKVLLVGDALAGCRPHVAASTSQAAFDAMCLGELLEGKIQHNHYEDKVMEFARKTQRTGVELGERSQFGRHPFAS